MTSGRTAAEERFFRLWGAPDGMFSLWHRKETCAGQVCVIHNPSSHHLREWPMTLRETRLIERMCPHRIGHPDPDSVIGMRLITGQDAWDVHGCDGCCRRDPGTHENW